MGNSITIRAKTVSAETLHPLTQGVTDCPVYNIASAECTWVLTPTISGGSPNNYYFTIDITAPTGCL